MTVSIDQTYTGGSNFELIPNPAEDQVQMRFPEQVSETILTIHDIEGKLLQNRQIKSNNFINLQGIQNGVYIIRATIKEKTMSKLLFKN